MRHMTKITALALAAATLLGSAGAASAHPGYDDPGFGYGGYGPRGSDYRDFEREAPYRSAIVYRQLEDIAYRVNRNDWRDRISEREADGLRRDIRSAQRQLRWFDRDGLDHREMRVLQARIDELRYRLHLERNDWDGRRG